MANSKQVFASFFGTLWHVLVQRKSSARKAQRAGAWFALGALFLILVVLVSPMRRAQLPTVQTGDVWLGNDVVAPLYLSVPDDAAVAARGRQIDQRHERVFTFNTSTETRSMEQLAGLIRLAESAAAKGETTNTEKARRQIRSQLGIDISSEAAGVLLQNSKVERFRSDLAMILHHMYAARGVTPERDLLESALRSGRLAVVIAPVADETLTTPSIEGVLGYPAEAFGYLENRYLPSLEVPPDWRLAYSEIVRQLLHPNLVYDRLRTAARKQALKESIVTHVAFDPGERIISRGEHVSQLQSAALHALSAKLRRYDLLRTIGATVFVVFAVLFIVLYARKFHPQLGFRAGHVWIAGLPVVIALALTRIVIASADAPTAVAYAFPAGMVGMLSVILIDARFALMLVIMSSLLSTLPLGAGHVFILVSVIGGFTAAGSLYTIKQRSEVLMAGLRLSLINFITILAVGLFAHPESLLLAGALGGVVNGLVCYVLTLGLLPLFEMLFNVTTDVRLIELTSTNHPLLSQMEEKAPGSFQHALNVAKLAEPAADEIGANFLLVRAGAYFHDVGKILKPKYYAENQVTPDERKIHSKLSPYMSNLIIKNHVKDGMELARKYRLPEKVADFVSQHQGTGIIKYFYAQALQRAEPNMLVREDEFRYPGPKPQTIEAAIVMLADTVEATATARFSGRTVKEDDIRKLVRDAINDKFHDGQFDECHMTFRDLHQISESFVHTLLSRYHHRVEYPSMARRDPRETSQIERTAPLSATAR